MNATIEVGMKTGVLWTVWLNDGTTFLGQLFTFDLKAGTVQFHDNARVYKMADIDRITPQARA